MFNGIITNQNKIDIQKIECAKKIIAELQDEIKSCTKKECGPFLAAIYDSEGNFIVKSANTVITECCSNNHAEINAIKLAEEKLKTHDLAPYNLSIYITSEPCIMCAGAIMWSGIKEVYYSVPSDKVEKITGFDEGFKHNWLSEFKKRGIIVYGNIESQLGEIQLKQYIEEGKQVYMPSR